MIRSIDRIGIAVKDLDSAIGVYVEGFGFKVDRIYENHQEKVVTAVLVSEKCTIELIQPSSDDSPVARFIERRGEGVSYISLRAENLDVCITELESMGFRIMRKPPSVVHGRRYTFIHPKDMKGVMFELTEY